MDLRDSTLRQILESIAARTPAPGGGAVASIVGALGAVLGQMAARYSIGQSTTLGDQSAITDQIHKLQALDARFLDLATQDADAYTRLNRLQRLTPDDPIRTGQWDDAVTAAIEVPTRIVDAAAKSVAALQNLVPLCNPQLRSDLAIAALLAAATARTAHWNVRVNLSLIKEPEARKELDHRISEAAAAIQRAADLIERECNAMSSP